MCQGFVTQGRHSGEKEQESITTMQGKDIHEHFYKSLMNVTTNICLRYIKIYMAFVKVF